MRSTVAGGPAACTTTRRCRASSAPARRGSEVDEPSETSATPPARSAAATASSVGPRLTAANAAPPGTVEASRPGTMRPGARSARRTAAGQPSITFGAPGVPSRSGSGALGP